MTHPLFGPEVRAWLQENNEEELAEFCEALHPATVAETLEDELEVEEAWRVLRKTNVRNRADIFEYFSLDWQVRMADGAGKAEMARLIEEMSSDDRADLLQRLDSRLADQLIRLVDEADRKDIKALVQHEEDTAGALMTTDYAWLPENLDRIAAVDRLRAQAPDRETIYYVYVLDDNRNRKLRGVVSLRDIIMMPSNALVRDVMEEDVISVNVTADREQVAQELAKFDLIAIPVTDSSDRLVGIITHDDVIDVVVLEATEDIQRQGAVQPIEEDYLTASFIKVWRQRAFWLAVLFFVQTFTFNMMAHFESAIQEIVVLALFVPLLISCGGNVGGQAAALVTRALALGQAALGEWWRVLRHEFFMGLALGATLGLLAIGRTYFLTPANLLDNGEGRDPTDPLKLTLVISAAVAAICIWGTLVGAMLPLVFKRFGIDPGIASGPFVATFVDVTGIAIYFTIAKMVLFPVTGVP